MSDDLVARRQRFIQRQIQLNKGNVNVQFQGRRPEGSGSPNRHDMPQLPVGQHEVKNWPVLDLGEQPDVSTSQWKLEVGGLVENPVTLDWGRFLALPQAEDVSDFHCVTAWSRFDNRWRGVRPTVRGVAMNPIDHPHGGGEGRTGTKRDPVSPWGKLTKGYRTRKNKRTRGMVVASRHRK